MCIVDAAKYIIKIELDKHITILLASGKIKYVFCARFRNNLHLEYNKPIENISKQYMVINTTLLIYKT